LASPRPQTDSLARNTTLSLLAELLEELGHDTTRAALQPGAHLERDLGLGSLERVELLLRLNSALGIQLPEQALAEAETVGELVSVVEASMGAAATAAPAPVLAPSGERPETSWVPLPDSVETFVSAPAPRPTSRTSFSSSPRAANWSSPTANCTSAR
jgi:acyl carrier protein